MFHTDIMENLVNADARRNSQNCELFFGFLTRFKNLPILFTHILNFELIELAELKRKLKNIAGTIGVNVNLYKIIAGCKNKRIADAVVVITNTVKILLAESVLEMNDKELGAVSKFDILRADGFKIRAASLFFRQEGFFFFLRILLFGRLGDLFAVQNGHETAVNR